MWEVITFEVCWVKGCHSGADVFSWSSFHVTHGQSYEYAFNNSQEEVQKSRTYLTDLVLETVNCWTLQMFSSSIWTFQFSSKVIFEEASSPYVLYAIFLQVMYITELFETT